MVEGCIVYWRGEWSNGSCVSVVKNLKEEEEEREK